MPVRVLVSNPRTRMRTHKHAHTQRFEEIEIARVVFLGVLESFKFKQN